MSHLRACGLAAAIFVIAGEPAGASEGFAFAGDPVLVGAGDIADCGEATDSDTAVVLDGIDGTVFTAGDNAYPSGTAADFAHCYEPTWGRHKTRTRPSPGNHDYLSLAIPYFAYFGAHAGPPGRGYYSYDLGAWHIVSLNSNLPMFAGSPQEQWLRADLAANRTQCALAYWHHPRFSSGLHGNSPATRGLWRALQDFGADVVVTGHDHDYEQFHRQDADGVADLTGIRQFVVGTGGTSLRSFDVIKANSAVRESDTHGVLKLTLRPTSYDWEFVPVAGQTFTDAGTRECVGTAPPAIGGRGFAVGATPAGVQMVWTTGTAQAGYAVARLAGDTTTILPAPATFLSAAAVDYGDAAALPGTFNCYVVAALGGPGVLGRSDLLCAVPGSGSSTGAPTNVGVQLNQGTMAALTWSAPGGQTGYLLQTIPLDSSGPATVPLPAGATRALHETGGSPTCYVLQVQTGAAVTGHGETLCALPGHAALARRALRRGVARTIGGALRRVHRAYGRFVLRYE